MGAYACSIRSLLLGVPRGRVVESGHTSTSTLTSAFAFTFGGMYIQQIGSDCLSVTERVLLVVQGQGILCRPCQSALFIFEC